MYEYKRLTNKQYFYLKHKMYEEEQKSKEQSKKNELIQNFQKKTYAIKTTLDELLSIFA